MKSQTFPEIRYADWRRRVEAELGDLDFEDCLTSRADGVDLEALCTADHPDRHVGGCIPRGWRGQPKEQCSWILCQQFDQVELEKLNHYLRSDLENGVAGIWLRLDRACRQTENPPVSDSVGVGGAALYRLADFASALQGTHGEWQTLFLDAGGSFLPAAAILIDWLRQSGIDLESRSLFLGADPLGTLARDGALPAPLDELKSDMALLIRHSQKVGPGMRALAISTQPYREAGAEIDQELAISLATGAEYLRWMEKQDLAPETTAAELALVTSTGQQIFPEIAKLRALRILWGQMLRACEVSLPRSPWIHASVLRRSLPSRERSINLLRVTTASLAAILGGAESIETPVYDWFDDAGTSDRSRRLARNTQLILGLEAQIGPVADPGAGSYFVETVTRQLVTAGWALFQEIERQGGLLESLASGWLQDSIDARWENRRDAVEKGDIPLTGVNIYTDPEISSEEVLEGPSPAAQKSIRERFTSQQGAVGPGTRSTLSTTQNRWLWCLESALENRSIAEMGTALYSSDEGLRIGPLSPRQDSQACEVRVEGS